VIAPVTLHYVLSVALWSFVNSWTLGEVPEEPFSRGILSSVLLGGFGLAMLWNAVLRERKAKSRRERVVLALGALTWLVCLPNVGTLATVLFFAGPLVGSAIWPVLLGLYSRRMTGGAATLAMAAGSAAGLAAYWGIGWYTGAIVGTGISFAICLVALRGADDDFEWRRLASHRAPEVAR